MKLPYGTTKLMKDYIEAKKIKLEAEQNYKLQSKKMDKYKPFQNEIGLIPDRVRNTEEYKQDKYDCDVATQYLRNINQWFMRNWKREYMKERNSRWKIPLPQTNT